MYIKSGTCVTKMVFKDRSFIEELLEVLDQFFLLTILFPTIPTNPLRCVKPPARTASRRFTPNVITYSAAIRAVASDWPMALQLLADMRERSGPSLRGLNWPVNCRELDPELMHFVFWLRPRTLMGAR